jgi:hypothetical protein
MARASIKKAGAARSALAHRIFGNLVVEIIVVLTLRVSDGIMRCAMATADALRDWL